jgi:elongator complex protein 6
MASTASIKIPPLLEPYLELPPEAALVLLTSVLGASANWLVLRWIYSALKSGQPRDEGAADVAVVLCSFLRDGAFWRDGAAKLVGFSFPVHSPHFVMSMVVLLISSRAWI